MHIRRDLSVFKKANIFRPPTPLSNQTLNIHECSFNLLKSAHNSSTMLRSTLTNIDSVWRDLFAKIVIKVSYEIWNFVRFFCLIKKKPLTNCSIFFPKLLHGLILKYISHVKHYRFLGILIMYVFLVIFPAGRHLRQELGSVYQFY